MLESATILLYLNDKNNSNGGDTLLAKMATVSL